MKNKVKSSIFRVQNFLASIIGLIRPIKILLEIGVVSCDMDKIMTAKTAAMFVMQHLSGRSGSPFPDQRKGHDMTFNIFSHTPCTTSQLRASEQVKIRFTCACSSEMHSSELRIFSPLRDSAPLKLHKIVVSSYMCDTAPIISAPYRSAS